VHALVLRAFAGDPPTPNYTPNHLNLDTHNNQLSNLEWASPSEQIMHSHAANPSQILKSAAALAKPVLGRKIGETEWVAYDSSMDASRKLCLQQGSISGCCRGAYITSGGFEFKYAEQPATADLEGEVWRDVYIRFVE
jgi:hypothetical protein